MMEEKRSLFDLPISLFVSLVDKGISLDMIYLLELSYYSSIDLKSIKGGEKVSALVRTLERKGFVNSSGITEAGKLLYEQILADEGKELEIKKIENKDAEWELFLSYYPPNDKFTWKGKSFQGDRGIRKNTKDGKELFTKILNESSITCTDLYRAVIAEAISKMDESLKQRENKMKYFINTESWLRQKQYLNWLEEGKSLSKEEIESYKEAFSRAKKAISNKGSTDI